MHLSFGIKLLNVIWTLSGKRPKMKGKIISDILTSYLQNTFGTSKCPPTSRNEGKAAMKAFHKYHLI